MNIEELTKFCSKDDYPSHFLKPFTIGDFTYAVDGRIAVRIPQIEDLVQPDKVPTLDSIAHVWGQPRAIWLDVEKVNNPEVSCEVCKGTGKVYKCLECDGSGEVIPETEWNEYDEQDCKSCDGKGILSEEEWKKKFSRLAHKGIENCEDCHGTGIIKSTFTVPVGNFYFNSYYIELIQDLPNVKIALSEDLNGMARFTFDGGEGLLMPVRKP